MQKMKKIASIIIALSLLTLVLSGSFLNVYISDSQLNVESYNDLSTAVTKLDLATLKSSLLTNPLSVTVSDGKKVSLNSISELTLNVKAKDKDNQVITASVKKNTDGSVVITRTAQAGAFYFTFNIKGKYDAETTDSDYKTVLSTTANLLITQTFGVPGAAFTDKIDVTADDVLVISSTTNTCPSNIIKTDCDKIMTEVASNFSPDINLKIKAAIKKGIQENEPFKRAKNSIEILSNIPNVDKRIVLNYAETLNPEYSNTGDNAGLLRFYDGNSKLTTDADYTPLDSSKPIFKNFLKTAGGYQYAFSQIAVNKAYSLLIDNSLQKNVNAGKQTIETLINAFPDLAQNYARDDEYKLNIQTNAFNVNLKVFSGVLSIVLPSIGSQTSKTIDITYKFYVDNLFAHAESNDSKNFEITLVNKNSYVGDISIAGESGIVYEDRLRVWLTNTLAQIHEQEPLKNAFKAGTQYTVLLPELYGNSFGYNSSHIFVRAQNSSQLSTEEKELKFLEITN